jgi:hypothetical protein
MKAFLTTSLIIFMSATVFSQKLPFQGQLIENGTPVTGSRDFTFNISDGLGGSVWTETQTGINVQNGLYSLVLGEVTPLPAGLFSGVESRTLEINVSGTDLSPIEIYPSLTKIDALNYSAKNGGDLIGLDIKQAADADVTGTTVGMQVEASGAGSGSGDQIGFYSEANGDNRLYNTGVWAKALGAGNGQAGTENYGVYGEARNNTKSNVGTSGVAYGAAEKNVGIYGTASGGTENYAGLFEGDVKISGNLVMEGNSAGTSTFIKTQDSSTGEEITALKGEVSGTGVWDGQGAGITEYSGILGIGSAAEGGNAGVRGIANVSANSASFHYGVYGISRSAEANSTAVIYGLRGEALGQSSFSVGVRGISNNSAAGGANFGGDFSANDNPGQNVGLRGRAQGDGAQTSENIGVSGVSTSNNSARNIGVYGTASNALGQNWAGKFDGPVQINADAMSLGKKDWESNPELPFLALRGTIEVAGDPDPYRPDLIWMSVDDDGEGNEIGGINLRSSDGKDFRIDANGLNASSIASEAVSVGEKDWEPGVQGIVHLYGDTPVDTDNARVRMEVNRNGNAETWGSLSLNGPVFNDPNCTNCARSFVSLNVDNDPGGNAPAEWSGSLQLSGQESPNVIIGGQNYQDSDLGQISLFGNKPDGNGWFYSQAGLQVNQDGSQEWGSLRLEANDGVSNVEIGAKSWEDPTNGAGRPYLRMRGNTPDQDLVWMEVADDGLGNELGGVNFRSTDGKDVRIDANGISGSMKDLNLERATLQSQWGNDGQGALELRDANDQTRIQASVNDDGASTYSGHINLTNSADGGFVTLDGQWGVRSSAMVAVAQGSNPGNNSIEMGDDQDAGYMNVNDANNANIITLSGVDGSINVKNGLVNVATGENNGNTSGTVNLGATSAGHGLRMYGGYDFDSDGNVKSHIALDGPGSYVYLWGDGSVNASNSVSAEGDMFATNFNTTSDGRLKENITPIEHSLANTLKLRGVSYNWVDQAKSQSRQIGVIAQEVEKVYPEFVHTNEEGMKSVNYAQMVAVLIEAIKELNTQIETLKTENASLKTELATASNNEKRITELEASVKSLVNLLQAPSKPSVESDTSIGKQE